MDALWQDLRFAARRLLEDRAFTLVAFLTLALGIGATTAIFSVVHAVLLEPLPFHEPARLVGLFHLWDGQRGPMSPPNFADLRAQSRTLEEAGAWVDETFTLTRAGEPARVEGAVTSTSFFKVLGVAPALGRTFRDGEHTPGGNRVVVLSHGLWLDRFGGEPGIVGRAVTLDAVPHQVIGVMPPRFAFPEGSRLWVPWEDGPMYGPANRGAWFLSAVGRVRAGVAFDQVQAELSTIAQRLETQYPDSNAKLGLTTLPLSDAVVGDARRALLVLLGAVVFVLLIACVNVANLLLSRGAAREGELAVRSALGASRARLVRQLVTESLLLGVLGGLGGLLFALWGQALLGALEPEGIPRLAEVALSWPVMAVAAGTALVTSLLFGVAPAWQITAGGSAASLREGARGVLGGRRGRELRGLLVIAETALAAVLLVGAGLLLRSFVLLQHVDPGFPAENALTFRLQLPDARYEEGARAGAYFRTLEERLAAIPGVRAIGSVMHLPLTSGSFNISFEIAGRPPRPSALQDTIEIRVATPGYFRAMGIPLRLGRVFSESDSDGRPQVALITETAARRFFPHEDPIGKRLTLGWILDGGRRGGGEIVGIVGDLKEQSLALDAAPLVYLPHAQVPLRGMNVVIRSSVPPLALAAAARAQVRALDADVPVERLATLEQVLASSIRRPRFYTMLLGLFAVIALTLASVGVFGVLSNGVAQRTREIGIRMALGAERRWLVGLVVRQAVTMVVVGVAIGLLGALALSRSLEALLFRLSPTDAATFGSVAGLLIIVALLASYAPARRASRVDPVVALRSE